MSETNAVGHTQVFTYNYDVGLPVAWRGPNGEATRVEVSYDAFGRLEKLIRPGDSASYPTLQVSYADYGNSVSAPFAIGARGRIEAEQYAVKREYYNGLGQVIQSQVISATLAEGRRDVLVDRVYDAYGKVTQESVPYAVAVGSGYRAPQSGPARRYLYDALGRTLAITATDGTAASFTYLNLEVQSRDAAGRLTRSLYDVWGRVVEVIPPLAPGVVYGYDSQDRLVSVGRGGATTTLEYDYAGRKTKMNDPDMGMWEYSYDAPGNLQRQKDARGGRICLYYDLINRLRGKHYCTDDACPACNPDYAVQYLYDAGPNGKGRRTSMSDATGETYWGYDNRGQLVSETRALKYNWGAYATQWAYNASGMLSWMSYPADNQGHMGEQIVYNYHHQMALNSMVCALPYNQTYVASTAYDAAGRVVGSGRMPFARFGAGVAQRA